MDSWFYIAILLFISCASASPLDGHFDETVDAGQQVFQTDIYDGFVVLLDYHRDLLTIKNTTTQTCFFSHLEKDHFLNDDEKLVGTGDTQKNPQAPAQVDVATIVSSAMEKQPISFEVLTNDVKVAEQCAGRPSYWLVEHGAVERRDVYRAASECCICCCVCVG